jgi:hypothetical protein
MNRTEERFDIKPAALEPALPRAATLCATRVWLSMLRRDDRGVGPPTNIKGEMAKIVDRLIRAGLLERSHPSMSIARASKVFWRWKSRSIAGPI